jgi:1,4-dihydroxy-2-naphthoate polyprenyltransferase
MNALKPSLWWGAFTGFYKPGVQDIPNLDRVSLFLYSARSVILVISAQAAIIAGLLAVDAGRFDWVNFLGVLVGFVVAHMISNLSNDYFGFTRGHDTPDSPRMRYTVHPLASGMLDSRTLLTGLALLAVIGLGITAYFIVERGWMAVAFAVAGVSLLFLYDAAPTPLKSIGLGEVAVLLVWGPLMIGGGFAMITGQVSADAMLASLPYGLGVMSILTGKHIDQMSFDAPRGIHTLPVLIGERAARALNLAVICAIYVIVAILIALGRLTPFAALIVLAVPRAAHAIKIMSRPRPAAAPDGYVGWPLWYHRVCLQHDRVLGWAYIGGLAAGVVWHHVQ